MGVALVSLDDSTLHGDPLPGAAAIVRLDEGVGLADLEVEGSSCGQYLMLTCRGELVALVGAMGSDVEAVEFADGRSYRVEELMDLLAG